MGFMSMLGDIGKLVGSLMGDGLMGTGKAEAQPQAEEESKEAGGLGKLAENAKEGTAEASGEEDAAALPVTEDAAAKDASAEESLQKAKASGEAGAATGENEEKPGGGSGDLFSSLLGTVGGIYSGGKGVFDKKRSTSQRIFSGLGMAGGLLGGLGSIFGHYGNKKTGGILGNIGSVLNMFGGFGGGEEEETAKEEENMEEMKELGDKTGEEEVPAGEETVAPSEETASVEESAPSAAEEGKSESAIAEGGQPTVVPSVEQAETRRRSRRRRKKRNRKRRRHRRR